MSTFNNETKVGFSLSDQQTSKPANTMNAPDKLTLEAMIDSSSLESVLEAIMASMQAEKEAENE